MLYSCKTYGFKILILTIFVNIATLSFSQNRKEIVVGIHSSYPITFQNDAGEFKGMCVDFLNAIEEEENIKIVYVHGEYSDLIEKVKTGEIDILPGTAYTETRAKELKYSKQAFLTIWSAVYVREGSDIQTMKDIRNKKVALIKGDYNSENFYNLMNSLEIPIIKKEYCCHKHVFEAVKDKDADLAIVDNTFGAAKHSEFKLKMTDVVFNPFKIYFVSNKSDKKQAIEIIDKYLLKWKQKAGSPYSKAHLKWLATELEKVKSEVIPDWLWIVLCLTIFIAIVAFLTVIYFKNKVVKSTKKILRVQKDVYIAESRFKIYINNSPQGIFVMNKIWQFREANPAYLTFIGYTMEELLSLTLEDVLLPENIDQDLEAYNKIMQEGEISYETQTILKNREIKWIKIQAKIIEKDKILIFVSDIDLKKKYDEHIHNAYNMLHKVINSVPQIIFWKDKGLNILGGNERYILDAGFKSEEEIIGKTDYDCAWSNLAEEYRIDDFEVMKSGKSKHFVKEIIDENGKTTWLDTIKVPLFNTEGSVIGILGTVEDVTEKMQYEEKIIAAKNKAEESDRLKTAFLHNMSHEIRTPMNAIMGFADILPDCYDNKEMLEKYSKIIYGRGHDLLEIIEDILNIARIESGYLSSNITKITLQSIFSELDDFFVAYKNRILKENVILNIVDKQNISECEFSLDSGKLKQILINLISNAFKFTKEGSIELGVEKNDKELFFYISDTGIGIPKEKYEKIFERFSQVDTNYETILRGTGLGLSIVKGLLDHLGGKIWLESEVNKGTTFYFSIPAKSLKKAKTQLIENKTNKIDLKKIANIPILVVEDEQYNMEYLKRLLSLYLKNVTYVMTGTDAFAKLKETTFDLMLLDIRLPDMSGMEMALRIKQEYPKIKLIAQTSFASLEDEKNALANGFDAYLTKPIKKDIVLETIFNLLEK